MKQQRKSDDFPLIFFHRHAFATEFNRVVSSKPGGEFNCDKQRPAPCISTLPGLKFVTLKKKVTKKKNIRKDFSYLHMTTQGYRTYQFLMLSVYIYLGVK